MEVPGSKQNADRKLLPCSASNFYVENHVAGFAEFKPPLDDEFKAADFGINALSEI